MGKIIARVRRREDRAEAHRAFLASPFGRILAGDAANPGKTIKFRRWMPPAWGISEAELRQPGEEAKNERARSALDALQDVHVDAKIGAVTWGKPVTPMPLRPDPNCPDCRGRVTHCGGALCGFGWFQP